MVRVGVNKESPQNNLKGGWVKAEIVCREKGVLKLSPPLPPPLHKNFNLTVSKLLMLTIHMNSLLRKVKKRLQEIRQFVEKRWLPKDNCNRQKYSLAFDLSSSEKSPSWKGGSSASEYRC